MTLIPSSWWIPDRYRGGLCIRGTRQSGSKTVVGWKYRCQLRVASRVWQREGERERGKKGRGGSYCLQSSPWNIESIGQVSSKFLFAGRKVFVFDTATTSISKLRQLWTTLYIYVCVCVYDRASILFLPRVKLAQFSLTSNAWPWLSFEQLFKSVCLTLRLPCFFFFLSSIFNPIFLFLSLESRDEVILREPTRKLPNFRSFSFIFSLEITRPTMFMRSYKSSRSLVISNPFASILSGFRFNKIFPRKRIGKKAQLSFFYFIHPICIIYDVQYDQKFHFNFIQMFLPWYLSHLNLDALAQAENSNI